MTFRIWCLPAATILASGMSAAEPAAPTPATAAAVEAAQNALLSELAVADPKRRAWAAYEVGARGLAQAREALLPLAAEPPAADDAPGMRCYLVVLDAIARLPGATPPAVVAAAASRPGSRTIALILAAREPEHHQQAVESLLAADAGDASWLAVRQLLAPLGSARVADDLARELTLTLRVSVRDASRPGGGRRRLLSRFGDGQVIVEDDFPPKAIYSLELTPHAGDIVLCDGYLPVYWQREEYATGSGIGSSGGSFERDAARAELLATMAARLPSALRSSTEAWVTWSDGDAYVRDVTAARDRLVAARRALLDALVARRLLDGDFARRNPPRIVLGVSDYRLDQSVPLPALTFADPAPPPP